MKKAFIWFMLVVLAAPVFIVRNDVNTSKIEHSQKEAIKGWREFRHIGRN